MLDKQSQGWSWGGGGERTEAEYAKDQKLVCKTNWQYSSWATKHLHSLG